MERIGNVIFFPAEGQMVALLPPDRSEVLVTAPPELVARRPDGSALLQLPANEDSCRLLWNLGLPEALAFSPLARDPSLPLVEGRYRPMRHQLMTAAFMTLHERCYVLSEPRLGKTGSVILAMDWLQRQRRIVGGVLVVTTYTTMRSVWARSLADTLPNAVVQCVHGKTRRADLEKPAEFYVTNYDSVRLEEKAFLAAVREGRIGAVVIDELTHVGNPTSKRSRAIRKVCSALRRVVGLTGSPADDVEAVFGMGLAVNPTRLPCTTLTSWREMTLYRWGPYVWQTRPSVRAASLINRAMQPAIRYRKSDVFDMPPVTEQVRTCDMTGEQMAAVESLRAEAVALLKSGETITAANGGVLLMRGLQIAQGALTVNGETVTVDHAPRTQVILEAIAETPRKVVVFSPFVAGCEIVAKEVKKAGYSVEVITGDVSGKRRDEILRAFQMDDNPKVLVCHPITVGFGTELSRADTMIFSVPLMLGGFVYNQSLERLSSVKQTASNINIIHVISSRLERDVLDKLKHGHSYASTVASFFEAASKNLLTD